MFNPTSFIYICVHKVPEFGQAKLKIFAHTQFLKTDCFARFMSNHFNIYFHILKWISYKFIFQNYSILRVLKRKKKKKKKKKNSIFKILYLL